MTWRLSRKKFFPSNLENFLSNNYYHIVINTTASVVMNRMNTLYWVNVRTKLLLKEKKENRELYEDYGGPL